MNTITRMTTLYGVAQSIGMDCNNPEGGMRHDADDDDIIEVVCDVANGEPYKLGVDMDTLTEMQRSNIVRAFHDGAYDR